MQTLVTQQKEIIQALRAAKGQGVTVYQLHLRGINSPTARITELRRLGYVIETKTEKHTNRHGKTVNRGVYILISEPKKPA